MSIESSNKGVQLRVEALPNSVQLAALTLSNTNDHRINRGVRLPGKP